MADEKSGPLEGQGLRETIDDNNELSREPKLPPDQDLMNTAEIEKIPLDDEKIGTQESILSRKGGDETVPPTASAAEDGGDISKSVEDPGKVKARSRSRLDS